MDLINIGTYYALSLENQYYRYIFTFRDDVANHVESRSAEGISNSKFPISLKQQQNFSHVSMNSLVR